MSGYASASVCCCRSHSCDQISGGADQAGRQSPLFAQMRRAEVLSYVRFRGYPGRHLLTLTDCLSPSFAPATRKSGPIFRDSLFHRDKVRAAFPKVLDEFLQHDEPMSAADDMRMKGVGQNTPIIVIGHVSEIGQPICSDEIGVHQACLNRVWKAHIFEHWIIIQRPTDGHFDQSRVGAILDWL